MFFTSEWERVRLDEVCTTTSGGTPSRDVRAYYEDGTIPWVKSGELRDGPVSQVDEYISELGVKKSSAKVFPAGTLLIAIYGATVGRLGILQEDAATNQAVCAIITGERVFQNYLFFYLLSIRDRLIESRSGGAQPNISQEIIRNLEIPLPPLPEQQRIAGILSRADRLRRLRRYALEMSEGYLQSVFLEMFGDPATNPMGWEVHRLGRHIKFLTSGPRGWADYYSSSGVRFIRSLDVQMNQIAEENIIYVKPPMNAEASRTRVQPGDVLLTITGSRIGRVAPVEGGGEAYVSQHVAIIRLDSELRSDFVSMFLSHPRGGQEQIVRLQYGQTKPGLNLEQIRAFAIPVPPLRDQERYSLMSLKARHVCSQQREALRQTEHLFQTLLHGAFRGEG